MVIKRTQTATHKAVELMMASRLPVVSMSNLVVEIDVLHVLFEFKGGEILIKILSSNT